MSHLVTGRRVVTNQALQPVGIALHFSHLFMHNLTLQPFLEKFLLLSGRRSDRVFRTLPSCPNGTYRSSPLCFALQGDLGFLYPLILHQRGVARIVREQPRTCTSGYRAEMPWPL